MLQRIKSYFSGQTLKDFEHQKPENWIWGAIYFNKRDYRVIVPKRIEMMGWTFNFAHPVSYIVLVLIFSIIFFSSTIF